MVLKCWLTTAWRYLQKIFLLIEKKKKKKVFKADFIDSISYVIIYSCFEENTKYNHF